MTPLHQLISAVSVIAAIFLLAVLLKLRGVLEEKHSLTLARIVTDICLPAIVFSGLATNRFTIGQLEPSALMLALELTSVGLAWAVTGLLGFSRGRQGAVVFCAAFGSSTFLGYSVITQMYPGNQAALGEAVLISEIGVGYPIFILGPVLAAYFGSGGQGWKKSLGFFRTPVFYALLAGMLWGTLGLPCKDGAITAPLFHLTDVLSGALTPLAILSVGLMFRRPSVRAILLPLFIVVAIKLICKPLLAGSAAGALGFPEMWRDILVILAAMPPAVLGVVFLRRYGGDAELASALLITATLISIFTLMGVFWAVAT